MKAMRINVLAIGFVVITVLGCPLVGQAQDTSWLEKWQRENPQWRGLHLIGPSAERLHITRQLITDVLKPRGFNVLILEVNYGFQYRTHPELNCRGLDKQQARDLTKFCREHGIRLIPLFNCLGHQSWAKKTYQLLTTYPQFDETPHVPADNEGIYCREWCPSHPEVNKIVFDLFDELLEAFDADALHVGMDEVFMIGDAKCPRCGGKDPGTLFAKAVNEYHAHLVQDKQVEMLIWGDRLLDAATTGYGRWEASDTGSQRAIDLIPKDIIICDWHYTLRDDYPSVALLQDKGFRVLPAPWKTPDAAEALIRKSYATKTDRLLGVLFTGWNAGGNGENVLAGFNDGKLPGTTMSEKRAEAARQLAETITRGINAQKASQ